MQLFLLRFWTLYDSMHYSSYVSSKMTLWKDFGKQNLLKLIAQLGIPLDDAKQQSKYLSHSQKENLTMNLVKVSHQFNMTDLVVESFIKQVNEKVRISAIDMVHAISAVLGSVCNARSFGSTLDAGEDIDKLYHAAKAGRIQNDSGANQNEDPNAGRQNEKDQGGPSLKNKGTSSQGEFNGPKGTELKVPDHSTGLADQEGVLTKIMEENFWFVYEEILGNKANSILNATEIAKARRKTVISTALLLFERNLIRTVDEFRFAQLKDEMVEHKEMMFNVLTLVKLALVVSELLREHKTEKPFVLCYHNSDLATYTLIGVIENKSYHIDNRKYALNL